MSQKLIVVIAAACALASPLSHASVIISSANVLEASPAIAGTGLNGSVWQNQNSSTLASSMAVIASGTAPTATFLAKVVDYTDTHTVTGSSISDGNTLNTFLGSNATNLSGAGNNTIGTSVYRFTGYIDITSAMDMTPGDGTIDVSFRVGSDDGMKLNIGGTDIMSAEQRSYQYSTQTVSFASAGMYAINFMFFEYGGNTGVDLAWETGNNLTAYADVATSYLYTTLPPVSRVSEPASLALLGLGLAGLMSRRRKAA